MSAELEIAELERVLESVLACFETEHFPAAEAMDATWTDVRRAFERVQAELVRSAAPEPPENLQRCQRLYAVATSVLSRRRDELAQERAACSGARRRLAAQRTAGDNGASCDMRG